MADDEKLVLRIRTLTADERGVTEKRMFGGTAFLLDGKMFVGTARGELLVRVGPEAHEAALAEPGVRVMDFTGKPMKGYVFVSPKVLGTAAALRKWIRRALTFVATVEKTPRKRAAKKRPARRPA